MAWDFETDPEFQGQLDWIRELIDTEIIPLEPVMHDLSADDKALIRDHLRARVKERGLWGAFLDEKLGGLGWGQLKLALMSEQIGRSMWSMIVFGVQAPDSGNMELLAHGATEEQKERWLWPNYRGEITSAFALTEPHFAGADPTKLGTTAVKDGEEWVLNGEKWMITNASVADIILVFAETNPENRPHKHASVFVVPQGHPGLEIVRDINTMSHPDAEYGQTGNHAYLRFHDLRLPADHLVGAPGDGFVLAQKRLGGGRIHHSMRWLGQARRSFDIMCERAVSRESHGKLLGSHQMIQDYIALSHMEIESARLLTFRTAWNMDRHGASAVRHELGMVKALVSRTVLDVLDRTIQVCGALGYSSELPVEGWYRSTRFGPIGDGPDELHKSVLARTLLKGYSPVEGWPTEHIPSRLPAAEAKRDELLERGEGGRMSIAMVMAGPGEAPAPEERPIPEPGPGEAVVAVRASSMNFHDMVNMMGMIAGPWPRVPMTDGCGEVVAVADGVRGVAVGDRVVGAFNPRWHDGTLTKANRRGIPGDAADGWLQQHMVFPADALVVAPQHLSDVEAATMVCAGTTAWSALRTAAVKPGDVVVTLGTGGVSMYALRLAKACGATVIVTSSSDEKLEVARSAGADHGVNYRITEEWDRSVLEITGGRGADLVVDLGGPDTLGRAITATRLDGTVAVVGVLSGFGAAEIPVTDVMTRQIRLHGISVGSIAALRDLSAAMTAGAIRPHVSHTFDWTELAEAQRIQQAGEHIGKIGITITRDGS